MAGVGRCEGPAFTSVLRDRDPEPDTTVGPLARWSLIQVVTSMGVAPRRSAHISIISGIGLGVSATRISSCDKATLVREGYTNKKEVENKNDRQISKSQQCFPLVNIDTNSGEVAKTHGYRLWSSFGCWTTYLHSRKTYIGHLQLLSSNRPEK